MGKRQSDQEGLIDANCEVWLYAASGIVVDEGYAIMHEVYVTIKHYVEKAT